LALVGVRNRNGVSGRGMGRLKQAGEMVAFYAGCAGLGLLAFVIGYYTLTHWFHALAHQS